MWGRGNWSHGGGGTPLIQMSSHVLGVNPGTPGYGTVALAPESLGLSFAKGTVPTPKGEVLVSWTRSSGWFTYQVTLPPRTKGVFSLEGVGVRSSMQVSVDRSAMKMYGRPIVLDAGTHRIAVSSGQQ